MNSVKISLLFAAIISSNQLIAMQNLQSIAGSGDRRTDTKAPWGKPGSLQRLLNKKGSAGKAADTTDDDALGGAAGEESPTTAAAVTSPSLAGTGVKTSPILPPVPPTSPKSRSATSSPSPKFGCAAGAGAGAGGAGAGAGGSGEAASAESRGYDGDCDEATTISHADAARSIHGTGTLLPMLGSANVVYNRSAFKESIKTGSTHFFSSVVDKLNKRETVISSEIDKAVADARDFPNIYSIQQVIELNQLLLTHKIIPSAEAQSTLFKIFEQAKINKANEIATWVKREASELSDIKQAEFVTAERYSLMSGPCASSPRLPYGMGPSFENPVAAALAGTAKAFKIAERAKTAEGFEDLA